MSIPANFSKSIIVQYDTTNYPADTRNHLQRSYSDKIVDSGGIAAPQQVNVYFNGQKIPLHTVETTPTFSKFYYELTIAPVTPIITIDIFANSGYINNSYVGMTPLNCQIGDDDRIFIEYIYQASI